MQVYGSFRRVRDRWRARRDGRRDGLLGIPTRDEVAYPPALQQITHRANEALAELARDWATRVARLREHADAEQLELHAASDDVELATATVAAADSRTQRTREHADEFFASSPPRGVAARISPRVYAVAIIAILIAEFPLNAIAFRLFGEAEILTWVMTASLAFTLVFCAHGLGTFLRTEQPTMAERRWIVVLVVLPVLTIVAIALIRARYLSLESAITGLQVLGPWVGSLVFLVINLLVYTGATMLSYLAHAPRLPAAAKEAERAQGELVSAQTQLKEATRRVRRHEEQVSHAGVANDEALQVARARAGAIAAYHRGLMAQYCAANLRARGNPEVPAVLREPPAIHIPVPLDEAPAPVTLAAAASASASANGNGKAAAASLAALADGSDHEAAR
jgi:hypothetical protein